MTLRELIEKLEEYADRDHWPVVFVAHDWKKRAVETREMEIQPVNGVSGAPFFRFVIQG